MKRHCAIDIIQQHNSIRFFEIGIEHDITAENIRKGSKYWAKLIAFLFSGGVSLKIGQTVRFPPTGCSLQTRQEL